MSDIAWNSKGYKKFDDQKAADYASIANKIFAPIYPVIAGQIVDRCNVRKGTCIDIGSGAANLATAITNITEFTTWAMDFSDRILPMARDNINEAGLGNRVIPIVGDVHRMPFAENSISLIVSRGSMRFWKNKPRAFAEIRRVLRHGGKAYVGGGAGSIELSEEIGRRLLEFNRSIGQWPKHKYKKNDVSYFDKMLRKTGFEHFEIIDDDSGFWVTVEK